VAQDRPKILIIDDEDVVLDSCVQILEGSSCQVATANDGALGLQLLQELRPDLVFIDLMMPGISGVEVLEQTRELDPSVVTIVITGYATVGSAVEAMKRGAYDFIPKPFTPDEFRLITQRGLERRRLVLETMTLRREKELLKDHFAAIVSHELKAPLGAVQQNLFALTQDLSGALTDGQRKRLERMQSSIESLLVLIHTWLRAYSADIEGLRDRFKPTCVRKVVAKAIESVQPHASRKDIEIVASVKEPLGSIQGDEGTLAEALTNILSNAVKFTRVGGKVLVRADEEDNAISISVTDTGLGIAEEEMPYIFEGLHVGKSVPAAERGSGLGLAITRRIIDAHQGSITVESQLGRGSTFVIHLPTLEAGPCSRHEPDADVVAESHQGGNE